MMNGAPIMMKSTDTTEISSISCGKGSVIPRVVIFNSPIARTNAYAQGAIVGENKTGNKQDVECHALHAL